MSLLPDLSRRRLQPELMDDPELDPGEHAAALASLTTLNIASRTAAVLWSPIQAAARAAPGRPVRILDIATGSGDVPLRLSRLAASRGVAVQIDACDISARAVAIGRVRAAAATSGIRFFECDVLNEAIPGTYDIVMCSLFMHHLTTEQATLLLGKMRDAASRLVLVSDLRRGVYGYALAFAATRAFSRSRVVWVDSLLSVKAAFTIREFGGLASAAGMGNASISCRWPARFLLTWTPGARDAR